MLKGEEGQDLAEYGLILPLVVFVILIILKIIFT